MIPPIASGGLHHPPDGAASPAPAERPGFTLVELLVSIAIIGTLTALLLPAVAGAYLTARVTAVQSDLRQIELAIHDYWIDFNAYPPARVYCLASKRHLYYALPKELEELGFLTEPLEDPFSPGQAYRYTAVGPGTCNDSPTTIMLLVPETFPEPGGKVRVCRDANRSPIRWMAWSVGPNGPPQDFIKQMQFNPADPAGWYPRDGRGIICRYHDGKQTVSPE